jgi:hypothetical protein
VRFLQDFGAVETIYSGDVTAADKLCTRFVVDVREQEPGTAGWTYAGTTPWAGRRPGTEDR